MGRADQLLDVVVGRDDQVVGVDKGRVVQAGVGRGEGTHIGGM